MPGPEKSRKSKQAKRYGLGAGGKPIELELPSGEVCLVTRPGVRGLIKAGLLDSLDTLTGLVQAELIDSQDPKKQAQAAKQLMAKPEELDNALSLVDRVVCFVVQEPKVHPSPQDDEAREPGVLYVDWVDEEDKMFIFNFVVGGTRDISQFRQELQGRVGSVSAVQDVPLPTE